MSGSPTKDLRAFGYAPGNYTCECSRCGQQFTGDKRAIACKPCAEFAEAQGPAAAPTSNHVPDAKDAGSRPDELGEHARAPERLPKAGARVPKERLAELPKLLREAERRVNNHVWGDRGAIVSIPADRNRDVDMLLLEAADAIEQSSAHETADDPLMWDTIAQNTRLLTALTHVTESWVNGRRVLDGIGEKAAQLAREALQTTPYVLNEDVRIGALVFRKGVKLSTLLARLIRGPAVSPVETSGLASAIEKLYTKVCSQRELSRSEVVADIETMLDHPARECEKSIDGHHDQNSNGECVFCGERPENGTGERDV